MTRLSLSCLTLALALAVIPASNALAHCVVGSRFFPSTLKVEDPCVNDEFSLTAAFFKNGDVPSAEQTDISGEFSKRITESFAISAERTWTRIEPPQGPSMTGFQNLETSFKYQFFTAPSRELAMSVSLDVEWGGTGDAEVGAESFSVLTPTFFVGKGFGDLREGADYVRAFAVTGQVGYAVPTESSTTQIDPVTGLPVDVNNPDFLVYGGSLQYSFPYLKANVVDLGLPEFINHLIPLVEVRLQTPVNNNEGTGIGTTGTVNPGVIYLAQYFQVGLEAIIPVNRESGTDVGVMGQLHLFLDDIFPQTLGKPLFSSAGGPGRASGT